ncbi:limonene-1,2-epoxide hydrolase [Gordonia pseudamarae]|jgi:limonene-1,2-epoxide hydrolase|uniref:Limonene-1,2-epoxide hydrolase n=1 Tax=Gordonia pseudamarae TaxID=2831662 RepID=A0ABX6IFB2_9ACTN|nr:MULTISPECIES: limonene-1,2-epoxide hydrolase family protein [Gordonia]MBD0020552.1 nuclear transport factor 2 family protein [Gordonia sp. (in: high G+C Gram-positive bacteria)]QHN25614.1 limonene-1,2-epoxide hydrolase [Gordonia pseudamarae]QHN34547.1 limonene-1,2-epoxide hydrolase [Gordonia pseudamarae]
MTSQTPVDLATHFLDALARSDIATAMADLDDDIVYTNVSLPTIRGKRKVTRGFAGMPKYRIGFDYRMVNVSAEGSVVLTERVDELRLGPLTIRFWVWGRFETSEGRITVWRDYFDYFDCLKGTLRGVAALLVPAVQRPFPARVAV